MTAPVPPPKYVKQVLITLQTHGFRAFLVGGCVRDMLLARRPSDWDIATDALPEEIMRIFPSSIPTGIRHGTVTVKIGRRRVEVTTLRADIGYQDHRRPDSVAYISDITADLARRDFTMNAIAVLPDGMIIDPFDGVGDIRRALVRCVGEPERRFDEDALRMFRAVRFSAQLGFDLEERSAAVIYEASHLAEYLAAERVRDEVEKILLSARPERVSRLLSFGLMDTFLLRPRASFDFTRAVSLPKNKLQRWTAFCALLETKKLITSTESFLRALRVDGATIKSGAVGVRLALLSPPGSAREWKLLLAEHGLNTALATAAAAETLRPEKYVRALRAVLRSGECFSLTRLAVRGEDVMSLGLSGAQVGEALRDLLSHVLEHPEDNERDVLLEILTSRLTALEYVSTRVDSLT